MSKTEIPFIGGAYTQRSPVTNTQQSINCFPVVDKQETTRVVSLQGTPGLVEYARLEGFGPPSDVNVAIRGTFTNIVPDCTITASVEDDGFEAQRLADLDLFTSTELELGEYSSPYGLDDTWSANRDKVSYYFNKSLFPTKAGRDGDIIPGGEEGKFYVDENTGNVYVWDKAMPYNAPRSWFAFSDNAYKGNYAQCVPTFTFDEEITLTFDMGEGNKCDANYVALMGREYQRHSYLPAFREIVVRGSNDGVSWRVLRTAAAHNSLPLGDYVGGEIGFYLSGVFISVPNPVSYRYFQLGFLSTYSHINDNAIWLSSVAIGKTDTVLTSNLRCNNLIVGGEDYHLDLVLQSHISQHAAGNWGHVLVYGKDIYATAPDGIYKQTDKEGSFNLVHAQSADWSGLAISWDEGDVYACVRGGDIYKQAGGEGDFVAMNQTHRQWSGIAGSHFGVFACVYGGDIYRLDDGEFVATNQTSRNWKGMTPTQNRGTILCVADRVIYNCGGSFYDFWVEACDWCSADKQWMDLAVSSTGNIYALVAVDAEGTHCEIYRRAGNVEDREEGETFELIPGTLGEWSSISANLWRGGIYACKSGVGIYHLSMYMPGYAFPRDFTQQEFPVNEPEFKGITEAPNGDIYVADWRNGIHKKSADSQYFVPVDQTYRAWADITAAPNGDIYASSYEWGPNNIYKQTGGEGDFLPEVIPSEKSCVGITAALNGDIYASIKDGKMYKKSYGTGSFVLVDLGLPLYTHGSMTTDKNTGDIYLIDNDIFVLPNGGDTFIPFELSVYRHWDRIAVAPDGTVYCTTGDDYAHDRELYVASFAAQKAIPLHIMEAIGRTYLGGLLVTEDNTLYLGVSFNGLYTCPLPAKEPAYPHFAFLDTCGFTVSVSDALINNSDIFDTVSGGEGGSAGLGGAVPALVGANGMNGVAGGAGKNPIKSGGGKGGDGGAGGAAGGDVKVVPSNRTKNLDHAWGGLGGYGGFGGKGGGRIVIFAKTFINNGYIGAFGMPGTGGYNGFTGDRVISSGIVVIPDFASCYQTYIHGGPGGGGNAGKGGDGGSVRIFYVNLEESGYAEAPGGFEGYQPGNAGFTKSVPGGPGGLAVIPTPTVGEGGLGVDGSGDGGKGFGAKTTNMSGGTTGDASGGANGTEGKEGIVVWTHLDYPEEIGSTEIRGMIRAGENIYVVMGSYVFKIDKDGIPAVIGSIFSSTGDVDMAYNGSQILIVDGTPMGSFVDQDDTVNLIFGTGFPEATSCCFMDGYFVVTSTDHDDLGREIPGRIHLSNSYDASEWDELDWATAEGHPDRVLCCRQHSNNLWFFGEQSTEVWYNSGNPDMPFMRIQGALLDDGTAAWKSIVLISDNFYWLTDKREVVMNVGYQRRKISTIHIDYLIQEMEHVSDAKGFEYRADGHTFYVLTFPTEDITLVYDLTTTFWHIWSSYKEDVEEPELPEPPMPTVPH